mmetsp:Transcript_527/g.1199  ORF Transcript_527/g.1199 Transcript_527/m.1199 type:complete len:250 (+) Transcript_527:535-1284(+)
MAPRMSSKIRHRNSMSEDGKSHSLEPARASSSSGFLFIIFPSPAFISICTRSLAPGAQWTFQHPTASRQLSRLRTSQMLRLSSILRTVASGWSSSKHTLSSLLDVCKPCNTTTASKMSCSTERSSFPIEFNMYCIIAGLYPDREMRIMKGANSPMLWSRSGRGRSLMIMLRLNGSGGSMMLTCWDCSTNCSKPSLLMQSFSFPRRMHDAHGRCRSHLSFARLQIRHVVMSRIASHSEANPTRRHLPHGR